MRNDVIQLCLLKKSWKMRIMVIYRNDNHIFLCAYPHSVIPFVLFLCFTPLCYRPTSKRVLQHNQKDDRGGEMWWELYGGVVQSMKMKDMKSLKWWTKFLHHVVTQCLGSLVKLMWIAIRTIVILCRIWIFFTFTNTIWYGCKVL